MLLTSALLAVAMLDAHDPGEGRERPAACEIVAVRSDEHSHDHERFRATRILELRFETLLTGRLEQERRLRLRLTTPGGFLYQILSVPIDHAGGKKPRLVARLPVAGTSIMASGLYGRWTVTPTLDDTREPCGRSRHFVIKP